VVAVIKTSASLKNALNYNEHKLQQKVAELIDAGNYAKDSEFMGFTDKIRPIEKRNELNERTRLKTVHISLNFDPSETLQKETLKQIASSYMQQIGFGMQPYLVYQHFDAGHPHIHIVTTNIQKDGSRISMQNIGRNQSEKARRQIELDFKLVQASHNQIKFSREIKPLNADRIQYGKTETRRAITNVLNAVLPDYKYSSLPELNAILRMYNVVADPGTAGSHIFKNKGLVYRVLNGKGEKVGVPVKASVIYNNPGLRLLKEYFEKNETLKQPHKLSIKNTIDYFFLQTKAPSLTAFSAALQKSNISLVVRQNDMGIIYGLTYIDHGSKCVFNGSDLGKQYSANSILERCGVSQLHSMQQQTVIPKPLAKQESEKQNEATIIQNTDSDATDLKEYLAILTGIAQEGQLASELKQDQRNKRRKRKLRL
jgi:hypothetical protein